MADDLDKEYRELMDRKGEDTPTPEEAAGAQVEQQQQAYETRTQESAAQSDQQQQQDKPAEQAQGAADQTQQKPEDLAEQVKKLQAERDNYKGQGGSERQKRRAAEAEAEAARNQVAQMRAEMQQFLAQFQATNNTLPNPEEDVVGTVKALQAQLQQAQQLQQQQAAQRAQFEQQNRIAQSIQTKVADFEGEFKAEHPDYDDALEYVLDLKEAEFQAVGYSKEQSQQAAAQWAMNAAAMMLRQGINPAEAGYKQAQLLGFKGKAPVVDPVAQAAAEAAEKQRQEAAAKIAQIKDGQAAGSKMSGGGNGSTGFDGSLKSIGQLDGAAFDSAAEKFLRQMTRG